MRKLTLLIILGLVISALTGCGDSSPTGSVAPATWTQGSAEDRADLVSDAASYPEFMEDLVYEADLPMSDQLAARAGALSAQAEIDPITFRRRVRVVERNFEFAFADTDTVGRPTRAILTVTKDLTGTFSILADDTTGGFGPPQTIRKPLSERWTRRLEFARTPPPIDEGDDDDDDDDDGDDGGGHGASNLGRDDATYGNGRGHGRGGGGGSKRGRWELVAVSAIEVDSQDEGTEITSVRFQSASLDTTIDDALELLSVDALPTLAPGSEVTITVTTNSAEDIVLLLARDRRVRLESNGTNTYTGTFTVPSSSGCYHFGVSALSHDTLHDDVAPYDSESWLFPILSGRSGLAAR